MRPRQKSGWRSRRPTGYGPRLLDGDVPEGRTPPGGLASNFSWRIALGIIAIGVLATLLAQYAC